MKDALYWRARWKELTDVHPLPLPANKAVGIFDVLVKEIKQDARHQALTEAAIVVQALGPCSGTADWNNSRRHTMKQAAEAILQLRDRKDEK